MIVNNYGMGVIGSAEEQTSVADAEIVTAKVYNFKLYVGTACTASFNGGDPIWLRALSTTEIPVVKSCKIQEDGIKFNWIGIEA